MFGKISPAALVQVELAQLQDDDLKGARHQYLDDGATS
jgi:hypothetical protein